MQKFHHSKGGFIMEDYDKKTFQKEVTIVRAAIVCVKKYDNKLPFFMVDNEMLHPRTSIEKFVNNAIERNTPKKPLDGGSDSFGLCPICKHDLGHTNYCDECGQAIDWGK